MHWRKSMSGRVSLGGLSTDAPATRSIYAPRDSVLLPPGNLPLPRGQFTQAMFDVGTLFVWLLLGCLAVLIAGSPLIVLGWILFFG